MIEISIPQIKKIKTMQRAMGLDDDAYRELLWGVARVKSCKELKGPKIQMVIKHLERCLGGGSKKITGYKPVPPTQNQPLRATDGEGGQLEHIRRLWGRVSRVAQEWGPESRQAHQALNKFLWGRFKVAAPEWLTLPQAQRVIEALKAMGHRGRLMVGGVVLGLLVVLVAWCLRQQGLGNFSGIGFSPCGFAAPVMGIPDFLANWSRPPRWMTKLRISGWKQ